MHKKQNNIYIGLDLHKLTHTAVIINCWNEKLGEITFKNIPDEFIKLIFEVTKHNKENLTPVFGLENAGSYGRKLAVYLLEKGYMVKDINPALSSMQRKSAPTTKKNDSFDALCVARVLLDRLDELPDARNQDLFWTHTQLVNRRESLLDSIIVLKNQLQEQLSHAYSSSKKYFTLIDTNTALTFWDNYPSPRHLENVNVDDLAGQLRKTSHNNCSTKKAQHILDMVAKEKNNVVTEYQSQRDFIVKSIIRDMRQRKEELQTVNAEIKEIMKHMGYKLETMPGIDNVYAAKLIAEIGDIKRFPNADKLARYAGIAPVCFSSAGKGRDHKSKQGNRKLDGIFHFLAVQMIQTAAKSRIPRNPVFLAYYKKKISEGKTKQQALVCIKRRLVNIIYGMLKNKTEYIAPPYTPPVIVTTDVPLKEAI